MTRRASSTWGREKPSSQRHAKHKFCIGLFGESSSRIGRLLGIHHPSTFQRPVLSYGLARERSFPASAQGDGMSIYLSRVRHDMFGAGRVDDDVMDGKTGSVRVQLE